MKLDIYQVDAFTSDIFKGNPACIVPLDKWIPDEILSKIAQENAVAETAFYVKKSDKYHLRWFTPEIEMDLCGHATLATAHVIYSILGLKKEKIVFETLSGDLIVKIKDHSYVMNLPSRMPVPKKLPKNIYDSLNIKPLEVYKARDYLLVFSSESDVGNIKINTELFNKKNLGTGGVICTSRSSNHDFVSRVFFPQASILEDPVTGSAHCSLVPFWSNRLGKNELTAKQISMRGGNLKCFNLDNRIEICGDARTYLIGQIFI